MGQLTGSHDRYDLNVTGQMAREDLMDTIFQVSREETPFISNIGKEKASNTLKEWTLDALATPSSTNKQIDGFEFTADSQETPQRVSNYCQISAKQIRVTRRANLMNTVGGKKELARLVAKRGVELKRDMEAVLLKNEVAAPGTATAAPTTAGVPAWLTTNTDRGATGADPDLSSTTYGYPDTAASDGTDRALSEATVHSIVRQCFAAGGRPDILMCGLQVKQRFSNYMFSSSARIATPYQDHGASKKKGLTVVGSVDVWVSDFGTLDIVPNYVQREDDFFVLDTEYWALGTLDPMHVESMGKKGDAEDRMLVVDYCLVSKNEAASGVIADIDETLAMTV